jgi:hypothetical protein
MLVGIGYSESKATSIERRAKGMEQRNLNAEGGK